MRRVVRILGLLATVLTISACGAVGGDGSATPKTEARTTETTATLNTLPQEGPIPAGEYETGEFKPAFSFRVGQGWETFQTPDLLALFKEEDDIQVSFSKIEVVFDPSRPADEIQRPAPESVDGWIDWLQEHPNLDTGEPAPATVGGVSGMRIDSVVSSIPRNYPKGCTVPCVPAFSTGGREGIFDFVSGSKDRTIVLNVEGEIVLVILTAPEEKFAKLLPKGQKVLDTVGWEGT